MVLSVADLLSLCSNEVTPIFKCHHFIPVKVFLVEISLSFEHLEGWRELGDDAAPLEIRRKVVVIEDNVVPISVNRYVFHPLKVRYGVFLLSNDVSQSIQLHNIHIVSCSVNFKTQEEASVWGLSQLFCSEALACNPVALPPQQGSSPTQLSEESIIKSGANLVSIS